MTLTKTNFHLRLVALALMGIGSGGRVAAENVGPTTTVVAGTNASLSQPPGRAWVQQMFATLKGPVAPRRLIGNIYYVGSVGVSSYLITTPDGHILIDTGFDDTVPLIQQSVAQLGFKVSDIKILLSSHAHIDHTGGHALMKKITGARVCASAADARVLASGGVDDFITFPADTVVYAPVKVDQMVGDGEQISLGGVTLTAHLTPGHTRGATTWTMTVNDAGQDRHVVFFSSVTVNPGVRLLQNPKYPAIVEDYEATFARLKSLPCEVFFAPHGSQFGMAEKFARMEKGEAANPCVDPAGWQLLIANGEKAFRAQLAAERAAAR